MNKNICEVRQKAIIITLALAAIAGGKIQAQEFKRQIEQSTFVPKGQWIAGSSISYSEHTEDNYQFLIIDGFKSDGYTFKDNIAAGGRFAYSRSLIKIDGLTLNIDDDNQFDINDLYQLRHTYSGMLILRNYISLGKSKRFALFNETQLEWSGSQSRGRVGHRNFRHNHRHEHRSSTGHCGIHQQLYCRRSQYRCAWIELQQNQTDNQPGVSRRTFVK